ncbi:MAG: glycoside hydrolase N-terminal domain-containing protein [Sphaerochaeta sp.]|nr:glycoside hydrolase N-terminal domain-containing protein [Sphaerochaeta sp.]
MDILWFDNLPEKWEDGLPFGNGRLAGMLWGDRTKDIVSLNHEDIWTGDFKHRECEPGAHFLPYVRDYLKRGENFKATALAAIAFGGNGGISPLLRRMDSFQPVCDIILTHDDQDLVRRDLSLKDGIVASQKEQLSVTALCHCTEDIITARWLSTNLFDATLSLVREEQEGVQSRYAIHSETGMVLLNVDAGLGVSYAVKCKVVTDGQLEARDVGFSIQNATYVTIMADIGSELRGIEAELSKHDFSQDFTQLKESQIAGFSSIMSRWAFDLEDSRSSELARISVNKRQKLLKDGADDAHLIALYARFGAYLMVSGSMLATLPLHLQGKWNHSTFPKWNSDYHLNINLQMNYWFTDVLGLDSYTRQMTDYILSLLPKAREAARRLYGCRGVVFPLNSDIWRNVTPEAYNYAVWISGAGWLMLHFWNRYQHTGDLEYLRDYAFPFFKEVAEFYEDYVQFDDDGQAQIMPSQSPENRYRGGGYFPVSMCISSAMDVQVAHMALDIAVKTAKLLDKDAAMYAPWRKILDTLPPFRIGSDGRLLEWDSEDKIEVEKGHRHFSHLFGSFPAELFSPDSNVPQFEASRKSLEYRLSHDSGHTGWSRAWGACLFARFKDPEMVDSCFRTLVGELSSTTLLDLHPDYHPQKKRPTQPKDEPLLFGKPVEDPPMIFQIDGNLGGTAAFIEALMQYRDGSLYLLPARPKSWTKGTIGPLRTKGGHIVSFSFENGTITKLEVVLGFEKQLVVVGLGEGGSDLMLTGTAGTKHTVR